MKKLIFILLCAMTIALPCTARAEEINLPVIDPIMEFLTSNLSADAVTVVIIMCSPRAISVEVTVNGEPVAGELVTFNRMIRITYVDENGNLQQDFFPLPGSQKVYLTDPFGRVIRYVTWGRFQVDVQEDSQQIAAGYPFKLYELFFNL